MTAAAGVGGDVLINNTDPGHNGTIIRKLRKTGCDIFTGKSFIRVKKETGSIRPVKRIFTSPYPGFPTDMQSQFAVLLTKAEGLSTITENIFENRFRIIEQLIKMGADISVKNENTLVIKGVKRLKGAELKAYDLRGSAALVIAGLMAEGCTLIDTTKYLKRGYEDIVRDLEKLGANIMYME